MALSTIQTIAGIQSSLARLANRITIYKEFLYKKVHNEDLGISSMAEWEAICPTEAEVEVVEKLIISLTNRITGKNPDIDVWESMHSFCTNNEGKKSEYWERQHEYFRWSLIWIERSRTFIEFLVGIDSAAGEVREKVSPNQETHDVTNYDVALSFAGEDRAYAKNLAELLRDAEFTVFYDEYEQASLWGRNLYTHLSDVYQNKARYCVMFLSENYAKKLWTKRERESAQARAFKESREYILPLRLDDTSIPGIEDTVGYLDLRQLSVRDVFQLLLEKLR